MGFFSRLFGRGREEADQPDEAVPAYAEPSAPGPVQEAEAEPVREAEPAPEEDAPPEPADEAEASPEEPPPAEPEDPGPPSELALTLDEATAALRAAGSDGIRVGFVAREYRRAPDEERSAARARLVELLEEQLRARGLLAADGRLELRDEAAATP